MNIHTYNYIIFCLLFVLLLMDYHCIIVSLYQVYIQRLERSFISDPVITAQLVHRIACAKILAVEFTINSIKILKERVGALSLQEDGPFGGKNDILYVFRFAEGDSAVLRQKMARDLLNKNKAPLKVIGRGLTLLLSSVLKLLGGGKSSPQNQLDERLLTLFWSVKNKSISYYIRLLYTYDSYCLKEYVCY